MTSGLGFRALPLTSQHAFLCFFLILLLVFWSVTDLYFFDNGQMLMGLSIAPTPVQEDWRPTLQRAVASSRESRVVAAGPSLPGAVPLRSVASTAAAAATVLEAILVVMVKAA